MRTLTLMIGAALIAAPAFAQTENPDEPRTPLAQDRGYDKPSARTEAINQSSRAEVAAANDAIKTQADAQGFNGTPVVQPADQARYAADMAEYRAALRAHDRALDADAAFSARQERAYADAMTMWRIQVADCRRGIKEACRAPSPNPSEFW